MSPVSLHRLPWSDTPFRRTDREFGRKESRGDLDVDSSHLVEFDDRILPGEERIWILFQKSAICAEKLILRFHTDRPIQVGDPDRLISDEILVVLVFSTSEYCDLYS